MSEAPEHIEGEESQVVGAEAQGGEQDQGPSVEDRALAMGWTPQGQFKGDPAKWVDAETFVKRGEEFLPFLKANNARLEKALDRTRADLAKLAEHHSKTAEREYQRALRDIEARIAEATAAGDAQGVMDAADELADLRADAKAGAKPAEQGPNEEFKAWQAENEWYGTDRALSAAFDALCKDVLEEGYTKPKAGLKEATSRLKAAFPEKFAKPANPNRQQAAAVEGGGAPARRGSKSRADLPADARSFMDRMVKQGLMTEAQYLKDFFGQ
ncbi:hypothetical protein [Phenylobacterium sp. J367]|uniref:hypothetical protein n=1 Tax=Phenylobacterium sp. J367 TaxID=2898435 RepID=UPI002150C3EA|nr:hypothetical protein [Phenylobacterium sp. J367]MCR5876940.1 hypothetical protein [Phenylobacterium sp. J367]MCR5877007.1 hypothetical protein [Phenylobacterium sp. J367]